MTRGTTAALTALVLAAMTGAARAADLPYFGYSAPTPYYNWIGPYVGFNLGYQWGSATNSAANPSGGIAGIQAGYNWEIGQLGFGDRTSLRGTAADDRFA